METFTNDCPDVAQQAEDLNVPSEMVEKYNQPGPRYTSYPTVAEWTHEFGPVDLQKAFEEANAKLNPVPVSLYLHLPLCESLCLYCGCNVIINKNHDVALPYLFHLKREIDAVSTCVDRSRPVEQMHWGGGTPTYLSSGQIETLFGYLTDRFNFSPQAEIGIEIEPRVTTEKQCRVLRQLGFNRLSLGVQDFNPVVQQTVHRIQPFEMTKAIYDCCRDLGFESINLDLIYGLPHQTVESFSETIDRLLTLGPDRIAMFSYAHVPWLKRQQLSFERFLPTSLEKFRIFQAAIQQLTAAGYRYIGLDHFAKPDDELCRAQDNRTLHRNFQGYTTKAGCDLYGLGVSSISGLEDVYAQNWRELAMYDSTLDCGRLPTMRGIRLSAEDKLRRSVINRILCHGVVVKSEVEREFGIIFDQHFGPELKRLPELEQDQLIRLFDDRFEITQLGRIFLRNVAMIFDAYLPKSTSELTRKFSKTL